MAFPCFPSARVGDSSALPGFINVLKESEQRVVLAGGDGIELMIVTARTTDCETQERGAKGIHPIHHVTDAKLFAHDSSFFILQMKPVEGRGQTLLLGGV